VAQAGRLRRQPAATQAVAGSRQEGAEKAAEQVAWQCSGAGTCMQAWEVGMPAGSEGEGEGRQQAGRKAGMVKGIV